MQKRERWLTKLREQGANKDKYVFSLLHTLRTSEAPGVGFGRIALRKIVSAFWIVPLAFALPAAFPFLFFAGFMSVTPAFDILSIFAARLNILSTLVQGSFQGGMKVVQCSCVSVELNFSSSRHWRLGGQHSGRHETPVLHYITSGLLELLGLGTDY